MRSVLDEQSPHDARQLTLKRLATVLSDNRHVKTEMLRSIVSENSPPLLDTFFREGVMAAVREYERANVPTRPLSAGEHARRLQSRARNNAIIAEARQRGVEPADLVITKLSEHKQIVALLDNWIIGNRRLGDCSKLDLLAAAARERVSEDTARCRADVYEGLAGKLGADETVAGVKDRAGILDLIRPLLAA